MEVGMPSSGNVTGLRGGSMQNSWSSTRPSMEGCISVEATLSTSTRWAENELSAALGRRNWGCWLTRSSTWSSNGAWTQKAECVLGCIKRNVSSRSGVVILPLYFPSTPLSWDHTWSVPSSSGTPSTIRMLNCWNTPREGPPRLQGWSTSPLQTGLESWGCSACRTEGSERTLEKPFNNKKGPTKSWQGTFYKGM